MRGTFSLKKIEDYVLLSCQVALIYSILMQQYMLLHATPKLKLLFGYLRGL